MSCRTTRPATPRSVILNRRRWLPNAVRVFALLGLLAACVGPRVASAAPPSPAQPNANDLVAQALDQEAANKAAQRDALLDQALDQAPANAAARWHRGYVRTGPNRWRKYDDEALQAKQTRLIKRYRLQREASADTATDQLALANWCAKHKLPDQERAHLTRVLELNPDHALARQRLGYVQVEGVWLLQREIESAARRAEAAIAAMNYWKPRLQAMLLGLLGESQAERKEMWQAWDAIDDVASIDAMEVALSTHSDAAARLVLAKLAKWDCPEASQSLARHAVFARSSRIRSEAAELLKGRNLDGFVPLLLSALYTPIQAKSEVYRAPDGRLVHRLLLQREGQEANELSVFESSYGRIGQVEDAPSGPVNRAAQDASALEQELGAQLAEQNAATRDLNARICLALEGATGQEIERSPEAYWQWWNEHNEVFVAGSKPTKGSYRSREIRVTQTGGTSGGETLDCLAAGTTVWTEVGFAPIESLHVGDRVLAQDQETGELAYKPVLRTTVRPPARLVKIETANGTIVASGGHPFWVSGRGWVKARDVRAGESLHGTDRMVQVTNVELAGTEPTYNLVVADFNTYFAGPAKVLSHDNTIRRTTSAVVPGRK